MDCQWTLGMLVEHGLLHVAVVDLALLELENLALLALLPLHLRLHHDLLLRLL